MVTSAAPTVSEYSQLGFPELTSNSFKNTKYPASPEISASKGIMQSLEATAAVLRSANVAAPQTLKSNCLYSIEAKIRKN